MNTIPFPSDYELQRAMIYMFIKYTMGFTGGSVVKNLPGSAEDTGDAGSAPRLGRSRWRRKWQSTPIFLSEKSHGQRRLAGYSP